MRATVCLLLTASAILAAPAQAETWRAFRALKLYVSDQLDADANVYSSRGHFVAVPGDGQSAYLITPKDFTVFRVTSEQLAKDGAGPTLDPGQTGAFGKPLILEKDGATMGWEDGGMRFRLSAKPPLIGVVTLEQITEHTDKYASGVEAYEPNANALQALRALDEETELVVGFGTWCSVCGDWLPRFIKTVQEAHNDRLDVTYVSINESLDQPADVLETYGIDETPTFIVRRDGKELGRVTGEGLEERPDAVLEQVLVDILTGR